MTHNVLAPETPHHTRFSLDPVTYTLLAAGGYTIELTPLEFRVLHYLMAHTGRICTSEEILLRIWGSEAVTNRATTNTVAVYIRRLRQKIEADPAHPEHIITVRRQGYMFKP